MKHLFSLTITILWILLTVNAQEIENFPPPPVAPVIYATETKANISVDGKLNEPAWQQAAVIKDFFRMEPRQGGKYSHETFVQVLFDKKNLYFGVFCKDSLGKKGIRV